MSQMRTCHGCLSNQPTASEEHAKARSQSETEMEPTPGRHEDPCSEPTMSRCEYLRSNKPPNKAGALERPVPRHPGVLQSPKEWREGV